MLYVLAAGLLVALVALLVLRPLLAPDTSEVAAEPGPHPSTHPGTHADAEVADSRDAEEELTDEGLEAAIAERRARMSARDGGQR